MLLDRNFNSFSPVCSISASQIRKDRATFSGIHYSPFKGDPSVKAATIYRIVQAFAITNVTPVVAKHCHATVNRAGPCKEEKRDGKFRWG